MSSLVQRWRGFFRFACAIFLTGVLAGGFQLARSQNVLHILVGPNVRVSTDSEKSHFEPSISSPGNGTIIASTNLMGGDDNAWVSKGYVSRDNGNTWFSLWFPDLLQTDHIGAQQSGDGITASLPNGRIFIAALVRAPEKFHKLITYIWTSDDRGRTWSARKRLEIADHERFLTDPKRHLVIMSGKGEGKKPDDMVVYVSTNDGTTFGKPIEYAKATGIAFDPAELADGSIFLPYLFEARKGSYLMAVTLHPQSRTLSKPFRLGNMPAPNEKDAAKRYNNALLDAQFGDAAMPTFLSRSGMLYRIEGETFGGVPRAVISTSVNGGHWWSKPRAIAPAIYSGKGQFAVSAVFNADGVLGVAFAQMDGKSTYQERFTASEDGGKTFLQSKVITTADSMPFNDQNLAGQAASYGGMFFATSGFVTRPAGGDYFGMTTDNDGAFHPVWIDTRDDTGSQLYTARIAVADAAPSCEAGDTVDMTKDVTATFDPLIVHTSKLVIDYPIRIHNTGKTAITGPLLLTITKLLPQQRPFPAKVTLSGTSNGLTGVGATLDFSNALGDFNALPPGGVTNVKHLYAHIANPLLVEATITSKITGRRCTP